MNSLNFLRMRTIQRAGLLQTAVLLVAAAATSAPGAEAPPDCVWAMRMGGASIDHRYNWVSLVDVDGQGNLYAGGCFTVPSLTLATTNLLSSAGYGFLAKIDPSGGLCWAVQLAGVQNGLKADPEGNCYLVGRTGSSIVAGGTNLVEGTAAPSGYLAKFNPAGRLVWGRALGQNIGPEGLAIDALGNSYVVASLNAGLVSFCGTSLVVPDGYVFCLAKLSAEGELIWVQSVGSTSYGFGVKVAIAASTNLYVTGTIQGPGVFGQTTQTNPCGAFLARYDLEGNLCWVKCSEGGDALAMNLAADPQGNVALVGIFYGPATFGDFTLAPNEPDSYENSFVAKYDPAGRTLWAHGIGGDNSTLALAVVADYVGNVHVAGYFSSLITHFDELSLTNSQPSNWYKRDGFLAKYGPRGDVEWAAGLGGWEDDDEAYAVAADPMGNCYLAGRLLSPEVAFGTNIPPSLGYEDGFLAKYRTSTPPPLSSSFVDGQLQLSWSTLLPDFRLETAEDPGPAGSWKSNALPVSVVGLSNIVCQPVSNDYRFFRLVCP